MYLVGFQRILCKILKSEFKFYFKTPILDGLHSPWNRLQMEDSDRRRLGKLDEITKRVDFSLGFFLGGGVVFHSHAGTVSRCPGDELWSANAFS